MSMDYNKIVELEEAIKAVVDKKKAINQLNEEIEAQKELIAEKMKEAGLHKYSGEHGTINHISFTVDRPKKEKIEKLIEESQESPTTVCACDIYEVGSVDFYLVKAPKVD